MLSFNPLISVIITTHNRFSLLKRAVESVFNQLYTNIEVIVVDDASVDETAEIKILYPRVKYFYIPKKDSKGGNYSRNLGILNSLGEYCAFLDDDDYWMPSKLSKQVDLIKEFNCDFVYCNKRSELIYDSSVVYKDQYSHRNIISCMKKEILYSICTTTSCILVKKELLISLNCFDENLKFWQEYELLIRLAQVTDFCFVNEPLVVYRIDRSDKNRLTNKYFLWKEAVKYIHNKHKELYLNLSLYEKVLSMRLVWSDAVNRCKSSNLYFRYIVYSVLLLPFKIASFLKNVCKI